MAEDRDFTLKIITPERMFYEGPVKMVEFNTTEGEVGILKGHIPMTLIVKPGVLNIITEEGEKAAALHAGFVEVLPEKITILAEIIEWPDEINEKRAEAARERAEKRLSNPDEQLDLLRAETALQRALARITVLK